MQYVGNVSQFIAYNSARVIMIKYKMDGVAFGQFHLVINHIHDRIETKRHKNYIIHIYVCIIPISQSKPNNEKLIKFHKILTNYLHYLA